MEDVLAVPTVNYGGIVSPLMLGVDLENYLRTLSVGEPKYLVPIYESVVNSIQSIQMAEDGREGHIKVTIGGQLQSALVGEPNDVHPEWVEIEDDGMGFTKEDFEAFKTMATPRKIKLGCKGMGRLSWIYVFKEVTVDSVYESDGQRFRRRFSFDAKNGTLGGEPEPTDAPVKTKIRMTGFKENYASKVHKKPETIARAIMHHCISFILTDRCPEITVVMGDKEESVNDLFKDMSAKIEYSDPVDIYGYEFRLAHVRYYGKKSTDKSGISYCGNGLEVVSFNDFEKITFEDSDGQRFIYRCYVSSELLDEHVTNSRDRFDIPEDGRNLIDWGIPSLRQIRDEVYRICWDYLEPYRNRYREGCKRRLQQFIESGDAGKLFSAVMEYDEELLDSITPEMPDEEVFRICGEHQAKMESLILYDSHKGRPANDSDLVENLLGKIDKLEKDNLARCIIHRKLMIRTYRNRLDILKREVRDKEKLAYEEEKVLHDILLPRGTDYHDRATFLSNNLWMLDDRVYFYSFLGAYSNKDFRIFSSSDSEERPDIVVFGDVDKDEVVRSMAIIELKRPMRIDKDVIGQVYDYIDRLKGKKVQDYRGRSLKVTELTTYHCDIICDTGLDGFDQLMRRSMITPMFGGMGYHARNPEYNAYIEVVDHVALTTDAERRNAVFFNLVGVDVDHEELIVIPDGSGFRVEANPKDSDR